MHSSIKFLCLSAIITLCLLIFGIQSHPLSDPCIWGGDELCDYACDLQGSLGGDCVDPFTCICTEYGPPPPPWLF
ncbi:hypothetical protein BV898_08060 [Hypsibius exemplaris]|uniref:Invertebrate defensins family profile domain-containing protein n=1 Tax=Hypsibius exemplaris TaxID=2072580 RepID=A0A1W0WRW4_HYPEX|nr:hypothetical protein BV898_08060 [Hypsibius exemplaris]